MEPFSQWFQQRNGVQIELPDEVVTTLADALGENPNPSIDLELDDGTRLQNVQVVDGHVIVVGGDVNPDSIKAVYLPGQDEPLEFRTPEIPDEETPETPEDEFQPEETPEPEQPEEETPVKTEED